MAAPLRIIPACAGNTSLCPRAPWRKPDHPRVRGEHACSSEGLAGRRGSSPRARGTLSHNLVAFSRARIIPACAGNTHRGRRQRKLMPDHPRVRGEHSHMVNPSTVPSGSSPRARGTRVVRRQRRALRRIIPACAGNTRPATRRPRCSSDHPRVRGEHAPRGGPVIPRERIIPACAGNTAQHRRVPNPATDHPRVRGEHGPWRVVHAHGDGSSPRARGTHAPRRRG